MTHILFKHKHNLCTWINLAYNRAHMTIMSAVATTEHDFESLIPEFCQDLYHFLDLVAAIRNPTFQLPTSVTYGRFKFTLEELVKVSGDRYLYALDPKMDLTPPERRACIALISEESQRHMSGLMVLVVANSAREIMSLDLDTSTNDNPACTFKDEHITFGLPNGDMFNITYRRVTINHVESYDQKLWAVRLKASESPKISPRVMMMITDITMPLSIIPGIHEVSRLDVICEEADTVPSERVRDAMRLTLGESLQAAAGIPDTFRPC